MPRPSGTIAFFESHYVLSYGDDIADDFVTSDSWEHIAEVTKSHMLIRMADPTG